MRLSALGEEVGGGGTLDELLVRECVAKVMLPILEAGWGTGGSEIASKVDRWPFESVVSRSSY